MIRVIQQPDFVSSAYNPIVFSFANEIDISSPERRQSIGNPTKVSIRINSFFALVKVGDYVEYARLGTVYVSKVIATEDISGAKYAILEQEQAIPSTQTLTYARIRLSDRATITLATGYTDSGQDNEKSFYSYPQNGIHTIDLSAFIVGSFPRITPKASGVDQSMFLHYWVKVNIGTVLIPVLPYKVAINSGIEEYSNSSYFINRYASDLVVQHNSSEYLWSKIIDDQIILQIGGIPPSSDLVDLTVQQIQQLTDSQLNFLTNVQLNGLMNNLECEQVNLLSLSQLDCLSQEQINLILQEIIPNGSLAQASFIYNSSM